jgi:hypothetical protein
VLCFSDSGTHRSTATNHSFPNLTKVTHGRCAGVLQPPRRPFLPNQLRAILHPSASPPNCGWLGTCASKPTHFIRHTGRYCWALTLALRDGSPFTVATDDGKAVSHAVSLVCPGLSVPSHVLRGPIAFGARVYNEHDPDCVHSPSPFRLPVVLLASTFPQFHLNRLHHPNRFRICPRSRATGTHIPLVLLFAGTKVVI